MNCLERAKLGINYLGRFNNLKSATFARIFAGKSLGTCKLSNQLLRNMTFVYFVQPSATLALDNPRRYDDTPQLRCDTKFAAGYVRSRFFFRVSRVNQLEV